MIDLQQQYKKKHFVESAGGIDSDVALFVSNTYADIADSTVIGALNTMVTSLKTQGLWAKCFALYPICGDNTNKTYKQQHSYNLKNPALYLLNFAALSAVNVTHDANGVHYVNFGQTAIHKTGFTESDIHPQKLCAGIYVNNGNVVCNDIYSNLSNGFILRILNSTRAQFNCYVHSVNLVENPVDDQSGFLLGSMTDAKIFLQKDGITIEESTSFTLQNFAGNSIGFATGATQINHRLAWFSTELTEAEGTILYNIVEAFQVALSRNA